MFEATEKQSQTFFSNHFQELQVHNFQETPSCGFGIVTGKMFRVTEQMFVIAENMFGVTEHTSSIFQ